MEHISITNIQYIIFLKLTILFPLCINSVLFATQALISQTALLQNYISGWVL